MKYATGLVVGKFCPLHKGHELLIKTALLQCEKVIILSYTSQHFDGCSATNREKWLTTLFPTARVKVFEPEFCPDDLAPPDVHRKFCAWYLLNALETTVQAVFTSEDYGDGFAEELSYYFSTELLNTSITVDHVLVDIERKIFPTSGTEVRKLLETDFTTASKWLDPVVSASFVKRIAFLGGESTGKSTLSEAVSSILKHPDVPEFGRHFYDKRFGKLNYEDMEFIAKSQVEHEDHLAKYANSKYLFCDTTPLTTLFYSIQLFKRASKELYNLSRRKYNRIYLCCPDFEFVQDGTRKDNAFRMLGHTWYMNTLCDMGIPFTFVRGSLEERIKFVLNDLESVDIP